MMFLLVIEFRGLREDVSTLVACILSTFHLVQQYDSGTNNAKTKSNLVLVPLNNVSSRPFRVRSVSTLASQTKYVVDSPVLQIAQTKVVPILSIERNFWKRSCGSPLHRHCVRRLSLSLIQGYEQAGRHATFI
jgi:hypothetical protein